MNIKLSHDVDFSAVIVDGDRIFPNFYKLKINLITLTENSSYQNVAIQRILIFLQEIFDGSILCNIKNINANKLIRIAKNSRVILLPEEPYDQIIAMILFHKLYAIVEGNFEIDSVIIGSNISPNLMYTIEDFEPFEFDKTKIDIPWWERSDPTTTDNTKLLKFAPSWADINLEWNNDQIGLDYLDETKDNNIEPKIVVLEGGTDKE